MFKSRDRIISGSGFLWHQTTNMRTNHALSQRAWKLHVRQICPHHPPTHAPSPLICSPLAACWRDFYSDQLSQHSIGGIVGKPRNPGEETAFSCLCSNSIFILRIASHEITLAKPVSVKSLERDGMSGCIRGKLFYTRKDFGFRWKKQNKTLFVKHLKSFPPPVFTNSVVKTRFMSCFDCSNLLIPRETNSPLLTVGSHLLNLTPRWVCSRSSDYDDDGNDDDGSASCLLTLMKAQKM